MARIIGIRHRRKKTTVGEARPTQVVILDGEQTTQYDLETEDDELDFVRGIFPTRYRKVTEEDDLANFKPHHVKWRRVKGDDGKERQIATQVPTAYDGLQPDDRVAFVLGGSGDRFAFALSRRGEQLDPPAQVHRITGRLLKANRVRDEEEDALTLAELLNRSWHLFTPMNVRERYLVRLTEAYRAWNEAMQERIKCGQRMLASIVGQIFCSEEGLYPEGTIEQEYDRVRANDVIFQSLLKEEGKRERELTKRVEALAVYREVFKPITGVGPLIAARLIVAIGDIRRFESAPKLKAFCGVHVVDGKFARKRVGEVANWQQEARQALYLLADQFNKRPGTPWGDRLRTIKVELRKRHPVVECSKCGVSWEECVNTKEHTRRYTDAHIHKMALWRTVTKFTEWLWREWWKVEKSAMREAA